MSISVCKQQHSFKPKIRTIMLIIFLLLQDTSVYFYQVFKNIYWMLKLNLEKESKPSHVLSFWVSLSKNRHQISESKYTPAYRGQSIQK